MNRFAQTLFGSTIIRHGQCTWSDVSFSCALVTLINQVAVPKPRISKTMKRCFDLAISAAALIVLSPILATLAALVRIKLGSPVLFRQIRPGLHGKPFEILKFRTMIEARSTSGELLPDAERLTRFGKFLRSSSLDELPELINVFKGDMSLVGPRPLLMEYLPLYSSEQARRHDVRPGLTGWAQVNGRNAISWNERFRLNIWYIENQTFWLDLKILFMTTVRVFKRDGISPAGEATMPKFRGNIGERNHPGSRH